MHLASTTPSLHFNPDKVLTEKQYFLWYLIFTPFYLPSSSLLRKPIIGLTAAVLWIGAQALWLQQGFQLEFNGISTFVPGLWLSSLLFFAVNAWILGVIVSDIGGQGDKRSRHRSRPMMRVDGAKQETAEEDKDEEEKLDKRSRHRSHPLKRV